MTGDERAARLCALSDEAEARLAAGDVWGANELLRQHRLVADGGRDPDDLLAEGMSLARMAADLAEPSSAR